MRSQTVVLVTGTAILALLALGACRKRDVEATPPANPSTYVMPVEEIDPEHAPGRKHTDWIPNEHKKGSAKWKDTGVYVDGKPVAVLSFGELPIGLEPVWAEEEVSAPKKYGSNDPGYRIIKQRRYRFTDYLKAIGVPLKRIKELHVYGPKTTDTIVVSGAELRKRGQDFLFRFGGDVWGKVMPVVPESFGNGRSPDKVAAVLVYIEKKPPVLVRNKGMMLDGEIIKGIPYYGEPMRGGVRVYYDNSLATVIKRKSLDDPELTKKSMDAEGRWKLLAFLEAQGIRTDKVAEGWIVREETRAEKLTRQDLETAYFEANAQAKGEIQIGAQKLPASALALHTKPVREDQLPKILPDEEAAPIEDPFDKGEAN